ncbi:MAG: hypothetical protein IIB83_08385 [Bacteroidetes bacterium]|nr:hypothetical protein [Bacteroidota bacterium]
MFENNGANKFIPDGFIPTAVNYTFVTGIEIDSDNPLKQRSFAQVTASNLETYSGKVQTIQLSYKSSGSGATPSEDKLTLITNEKIPDSSNAEYINTYKFNFQSKNIGNMSNIR